MSAGTSLIKSEHSAAVISHFERGSVFKTSPACQLSYCNCFLRLLLPYERHMKGQSDAPLPLVKAKKQEGSQGDKGAPARAKGSGAKKSKGSHNNPKQGRGEKREKDDATENAPSSGPPPLQESAEAETAETRRLSSPPPAFLRNETPPLSERAEPGPPPALRPPPYPLAHRWDHQNKAAALAGLSEPAARGRDPSAAAAAEGHGGRVGKVLPMFKQQQQQQQQADRQSGDPSGADSSSPEKNDFGVPRREVHPTPPPPPPPPPQPTAYCKAGQGVMSPLAKKKLLSQVCDANPFSFASPSAPLAPPPPAPAPAPLPVQLPLPPPPSFVTGGDRERERRSGGGGDGGGVSDGGAPEVATVFRPSVIQHAQSAKAPHHHPAAGGDPAERNPLGELSGGGTYACRTNHHLRPQVSPPWQPFLPQPPPPPAQNGAEKLLRGSPPPPAPSHANHGYVADCYSSPHLHSLYRQTENCLSHERMAGFSNGEKRGHYVRDGEGREGFVCGGGGGGGLECEGLAFRSHYGDRTHTHSDGGGQRDADDQPRDFTIAKPLSQRMSPFSKPPPFCSLQYPIMHQGGGGGGGGGGLDSHPKACRVPPMTVSSPKPRSGSPDPSSPSPFPRGKPSGDAPLAPSPCRPAAVAIKRSLGETENEGVGGVGGGGGGGGAPDRKVRVVTPMHPAGSLRRGDPEDLKAAEPAHAHAARLHDHLSAPEGHPATAYPSPLYPGMYVSARQQDGLHHQQQQHHHQQQQQQHQQQHHHHHHPGLQYLKSQTAVSPLVPPMAFHSMLFHRHLLATAPSPHPFYRHPGGAALYGDLLHHLYPLSTLPPPQLSSVHPSTRL
ncbi:unnamed protein product [Merluccius merluccius]